MRLKDKVIVITGAAGSLGSALAKRFVEEGAGGLVLTDLKSPGLTALSQAVRSNDVVMEGDVTDANSLEAVVAAAVEKFGRLDVMVNNAGVLGPNGRIHNVTPEQWQKVIDVNLMGVVHGTTAAVKVMKAAGHGAIVNTASVSGLTAWSHSAPYCITKAAVIHLTKVTAIEYAADGIRANCVCPGSFHSAMFAGVPNPAIEAIDSKHPLGLGTVDALLGTYVLLASDESSWMTGSAVTVDGGYSAV